MALKRPARRAHREADARTTPSKGQTVGVRELKSSLSEYLRRIAGGESILVTDRGKPVARLVPPDLPAGIVQLMREGRLQWSGRKPDLSRPRVVLGPGKTLSDYVIEDRR